MHDRRAFTIVELLVVVSILMLLMAMLLPSLVSAREVARRAKCLSQAHQLAVGVMVYANDFEDRTPVMETWALHFVSSTPGRVRDERPLLEELSGDPQTFYCPSHAALSIEHPTVGWRASNPNRYMSYGAIGIWQQSSVAVSWPKTYTELPVNLSPSVANQGNRPTRLTDARPDLGLVTDAQIPWYAGSWGLSFTYPGDGQWPEDPGYYAYYAYPHRTGSNRWAGTNVVFFDGSGGWRGFTDIFDAQAPYPHGAKWIMHYQRGIFEGAVFW